jgi:hypothetical protein
MLDLQRCSTDLTAADIEGACNDSLKRITETIDRYSRSTASPPRAGWHGVLPDPTKDNLALVHPPRTAGAAVRAREGWQQAPLVCPTKRRLVHEFVHLAEQYGLPLHCSYKIPTA